MKVNKQKIQVLYIALLALFFTNATFSQNEKRKVLYTLGDSETLSQTEFSFQTDQIKYFCLTIDEKRDFDQKMFLIVNDKIVEKSSNISKAGDSYSTPFINIFDMGKSAYKYAKGKEFFLKYNGKEYGSYEDVELLVNWYEYPNCVIKYKQMGQFFLLLPQGRIIRCIGNDVDWFYLDSKSGAYFYETRAKQGSIDLVYNGKYVSKYETTNIVISSQIYFNSFGNGIFSKRYHYFCINDTKIQKDADDNKVILTDGGKYAFVYHEDGKEYLSINGEFTFGGYDGDSRSSCISCTGISGFDINDKGGYIYRYTMNNQDYVNVNGHIVGKHDKISDYIDYFEHAEWINNSDDYEKGWNEGTWHEAQPFAKPSINNKNDYIYAYRSNGKFYVSINEKREGPYQEAWAPKMDEKGNYMYWCAIDGKYYIVRNGEKSNSYEYASLPQMTNDGHYCFEYKKDGKLYVNIDGSIEGPYDSVNFDLWEEVRLNKNGRYGYRFINNGIHYVCINGKIYKEPISGGKWNIRSDSQEGFKAEYIISIDKEGKTCDSDFGDNEKFIFDQNGNIINAEIRNTIYRYNTYSYIAKNEKDIMQCSGQYPYVLINNQKYGNGNILAAGYNRSLNVFRWAVLEDKELVVYEYKIKE